MTEKTYKIIKKAIKEMPMTERERTILSLRFGIKTGKIETLEVVGRIFGVTRERIRQIEGKTLEKVREFYPQEFDI